MKVTFVIESLSKGGAERVVCLLSHELYRQGHDVNIVTFTPTVSYSYDGQLFCLNLPILASYGKIKLFLRYIRRIFVLRRFLKKHQTDQLFSFMEVSSLLSILAFRKKTRVCVRNNPDSFSSNIKRAMKVLYPFADKIICNSKEQVYKLRNMISHPDISYIHNPLAFDIIDKFRQEQICIQKLFILAVGRLCRQKRFDLLIKAYKNSQLSSNLDLVILGEGQEKCDLDGLVFKLGISDRVHFLGAKDNPYAYMEKCYFFVLSSDYEGFPNVLVEALACEAAVISTNCSTGPAEIIREGENGILVKTGDVEALSRAMSLLYINQDVRLKLKSNARASVQHLQVAVIANQFLKV